VEEKRRTSFLKGEIGRKSRTRYKTDWGGRNQKNEKRISKKEGGGYVV